MKLTKINEYAIPKHVSSLTPHRDTQVQNIRNKLLQPMADKETDKTMRIVKDFKEWSGGFKPSSPEEIQTYIATSCPSDMDESQVWSFLTDWMETVDD